MAVGGRPWTMAALLLSGPACVASVDDLNRVDPELGEMADTGASSDAASVDGSESQPDLGAPDGGSAQQDGGVGPSSLIFYEPFEGLASIEQNEGRLTGPSMNFVPGVQGQGADFSLSRRVCYPLPAAFDPTQGTIELWVNRTTQPAFGGVFDIGNLGFRRSWGLFRTIDLWWFEIRNGRDVVNQVNPPVGVPETQPWLLLTAVWEERQGLTWFRLCLDGRCRNEFKTTDQPGPDGSRFCLGWNGFYGYSDSQLDEFRMYNYAKTTAEIAAQFPSAN